jgi:hypothetical protein
MRSQSLDDVVGTPRSRRRFNFPQTVFLLLRNHLPDRWRRARFLLPRPPCLTSRVGKILATTAPHDKTIYLFKRHHSNSLKALVRTPF